MSVSLCCLLLLQGNDVPAGRDDTHQVRVERAVSRGVAYLLKTQRADGAWGGPTWTGGVDRDPVPGAFRSFDAAVTALCLEALLDEPGDAAATARERALEFLFDRLPRLRRAGPNDLPNVWAHCYAIQVFAELHRRSDADMQRRLEYEITQQMEALERYETIHGGWFYYANGLRKPRSPSCSFVNAAVLLALDRARPLGLNADDGMVRRAIRATTAMRKPDSSFIYSARTIVDHTGAMRPINRPAGSLGRSQAGNLALRRWGDARIDDEVIRTWLDRLVQRHGWLDMGRKRPLPHESHAAVAGYFYYFGMYYGALCLAELPRQERAPHQHAIARLLVDRQEPDGSWFDYPLYSYHKPYGTAFALMALRECLPDRAGR